MSNNCYAYQLKVVEKDLKKEALIFFSFSFCDGTTDWEKESLVSKNEEKYFIESLKYKVAINGSCGYYAPHFFFFTCNEWYHYYFKLVFSHF